MVQPMVAVRSRVYVSPTRAGIHGCEVWISAFAGMSPPLATCLRINGPQVLGQHGVGHRADEQGLDDAVAVDEEGGRQ